MFSDAFEALVQTGLDGVMFLFSSISMVDFCSEDPSSLLPSRKVPICSLTALAISRV